MMHCNAFVIDSQTIYDQDGYSQRRCNPDDHADDPRLSLLQPGQVLHAIPGRGFDADGADRWDEGVQPDRGRGFQRGRAHRGQRVLQEAQGRLGSEVQYVM